MAPDSRFAGMLAQLTQALDAADPPQLARGARQAYCLAFGTTALLGALLGVLALWWRPLELSHPPAAWALAGTAAGLAALTFWLSGWQLRRELAPLSAPRQRRAQLLAAAFGLSAAPAVPWLLACAALPWPALALALACLSALAYALGRWQLGQWAQQV